MSQKLEMKQGVTLVRIGEGEPGSDIWTLPEGTIWRVAELREGAVCLEEVTSRRISVPAKWMTDAGWQQLTLPKEKYDPS